MSRSPSAQAPGGDGWTRWRRGGRRPQAASGVSRGCAPGHGDRAPSFRAAGAPRAHARAPGSARSARRPPGRPGRARTPSRRFSWAPRQLCRKTDPDGSRASRVSGPGGPNPVGTAASTPASPTPEASTRRRSARRAAHHECVSRFDHLGRALVMTPSAYTTRSACDLRRTAPLLSAYGPRARCSMEADGPRYALEGDVADELELDLGGAGALHRPLAHQHLVGPGIVGDPGGDVHRSPEVVAFLDDDRPGVDADPGGHGDRPLRLLDELEAAQDCSCRVAEVEHDAVAEPLDRAAAARLRGLLHDASEGCGQLGRGLISPLFRERRVAREVQEGDRGRLSLLPRCDPSLLHEALGDADDVLEDGVLPVPSLEPGNDVPHELRETRRLLVDEAVFLLVREVEGRDPLANRSVEELEPGADESLHAAAVQPGEARKVVVSREIELAQHEGEHLGVFPAHAIVLPRRETELAAEPAQEVGRALKPGGELLVGRRHRHRLRKEKTQGKRELSCGHAARDVLERDPSIFEGGHETNDVHGGRGEQAVLLLPLEDAQVLQPAYMLERARNELHELLGRDPGHGVTLLAVRFRSVREAGAQLVGGQIRRVDGPARLVLATTLGERAGVNRVEADLIDQLGHDPLGLLVVARDRDAEAPRVSRGPAEIAETLPLHGVERLDDAGTRQVALEQLARGGVVVVELFEVPVSLRVVVVRVDDDLAGHAVGGQLPEAAERHRDDDDFPEADRVRRRHRLRPLAELLDD